MTEAVSERRVLVQLSDLHYIGNGQLHGGLSLQDTFERVHAALALDQYHPNAIVITGDLVHRGSQAPYEDLIAEFDRLRERFNTPVVVTFGNHDDIDRAARFFPINQNVQLKTHRIITFNNADPQFTPEQAEWLAEELAEPYRSGTILAFHHSPLPSPVPGLKNRGMTNTDLFAETIAGSDVVQIVTGHYHHVLSGQFAGIPCWSSPALSTHQLMTPPSGMTGLVRQSGFSVIEFAEYGPIASALWLDEYPEALLKTI